MSDVWVLPSTRRSTAGASGEPCTKRRFPVSLLLAPPHASPKVKTRSKAKRRTPQRKLSLQCNLNVYQKLGNSGNRMRARGRLMCPHRYSPAEFRSALYFFGSVKFSVMVVSTSSGLPFRRYGLNFHCFTASRAAPFSIGDGVFTTFALCTFPSFPTITDSRNAPSMLILSIVG